MPNGILVNYTVLLGGTVVIATPPTALSYNVTGLSPFTPYNLSVLACTSVDCVESPSLQATTQEDGKLQSNTCILFFNSTPETSGACFVIERSKSARSTPYDHVKRPDQGMGGSTVVS